VVHYLTLLFSVIILLNPLFAYYNRRQLHLSSKTMSGYVDKIAFEQDLLYCFYYWYLIILVMVISWVSTTLYLKCVVLTQLFRFNPPSTNTQLNSPFSFSLRLPKNFINILDSLSTFQNQLNSITNRILY